MRDATECNNLIGYALFAVIKAIFSNPNGLEMIMNNIYKKLIKSKNKKKKPKYSDRVRTRNLHDSGHVIHPRSYSKLVCAYNILDVLF